MTSEASGVNGPASIPVRVTGAPDWLESTLNLTAGRDPLGFQTITTDRIIPRLVPGILALSRRARYFSFYAFLLDEYRRRELGASNNGLSAFMKRREYELALAIELCPVGHRNEAIASNGRQRAGPAVASGRATFARQESVDSFLGGYGLYYRSPMIELGLVAPRGTPIGEDDRATPIDVLVPGEPRGAALAAAFRAAVSGTEYHDEYLASDREIPRGVLADYARVACICRLDGFPDEQALLRDALLVPSPGQPAPDVVRRREAFAFLLWLAERDERVVRSDAAFREQIWHVHAAGEARGNPALASTAARWAALVAKECVQEGISSIWARVCQAGLAATGHDGIAAADLDRDLVVPLVGPRELAPFGGRVTVGPETPTASLREAVLAAAAGHSIEALRAWAVEDGSALAGLALVLGVDGRVRGLGDAPQGWAEISSQDSDWQPGLAHLLLRLRHHLESDPTVIETMAWVVRTFVLWPHELIAYSKLPQSTFRFRWESGRLRFYDLSPERFQLTDNRRDSLGRLAADMGLLAWTANGAVPTKAGQAFVGEVLG